MKKVIAVLRGGEVTVSQTYISGSLCVLLSCAGCPDQYTEHSIFAGKESGEYFVFHFVRQRSKGRKSE
jgi:hypothetical protein